MTSGLYRRLLVRDPSLQLYELSDVPGDTTPRQIVDAFLPEGATQVRAIVDARDGGGEIRRLRLDAPLRKQKVLDTTVLELSADSRAGGGGLEFTLGLLGGSVLIPFAQAIGTKAGEDAYARVRELLGRRSRRPADGEDIVLGHRRSKIVLRVSNGDARRSPDENRGPTSVGRDESTTQWTVVTWDPGERRFTEELVDAPPLETVFVRQRWRRPTRRR